LPTGTSSKAIFGNALNKLLTKREKSAPAAVA